VPINTPIHHGFVARHTPDLNDEGEHKHYWYTAAKYATYIANKISICPSKEHTVWQEYYKKKANFFTDYPFGTLAFIILTPVQQLDKKVDHSLDHEV
jgi:hypothetical protein